MVVNANFEKDAVLSPKSNLIYEPHSPQNNVNGVSPVVAWRDTPTPFLQHKFNSNHRHSEIIVETVPLVSTEHKSNGQKSRSCCCFFLS